MSSQLQEIFSQLFYSLFTALVKIRATVNMCKMDVKGKIIQNLPWPHPPKLARYGKHPFYNYLQTCIHFERPFLPIGSYQEGYNLFLSWIWVLFLLLWFYVIILMDLLEKFQLKKSFPLSILYSVSHQHGCSRTL